ncbi:MAG: carbon-nitrogen hydrolase family protein [Planctomycetota bacterium]
MAFWLFLWTLGGASSLQVEAPKTAIRVAGAQIPVTRDVRANREALFRALDYAAAEKAEVLVTPEGALSGYWPGFDARATREALEEVVRRAAERKIALVLGTCFEENDGRRYDQQRFYAKDGTFLGFHAKILLCRRVSRPAEKGEIDFFHSKPLEVFALESLRVGGLICNDLWANPEWTPMEDPHLTQKLAQGGARIVFHSVNSGQGMGDELELNRAFHEANLRLRARAGRLWIVVADAADPEGAKASQCPSGIVGPEGRWVLKVSEPGERFFAHTIHVEP